MDGAVEVCHVFHGAVEDASRCEPLRIRRERVNAR
jgi:hypothetical protein